jgi:hypothetical protein
MVASRRRSSTSPCAVLCMWFRRSD